MKLFDDIDRTHSKRALYSESRFSFLNRSTWPECGRMRDVLEEWFSRYPVEHQKELAARFRADGWSYEAAFFELCLHELLLRLGCNVQVHPDIAGITTHPEFLVSPQSGDKFILEAVLATNQTDKELRENAVFNKLFDELDRLVESNNFFVSVHQFGKPKQQPSASKIAEFLHKQLRELDPDWLADEYGRSGIAALRRWLYPIDNECHLEFIPISRRPEVRDEPNTRPIGAIGTEGRLVEDVEAIRNAIQSKASRYGSLGMPYVIAVNLMSETIEDQSPIEALYHSGGVWDGNRKKQVSAVLATDWLMPISAAHANPRLFHNPAASKPYNSVLTSLPQVFQRSSGIERVDGRSLGDILGSSPPWPHDPTDDQANRD